MNTIIGLNISTADLPNTVIYPILYSILFSALGVVSWYAWKNKAERLRQQREYEKHMEFLATMEEWKKGRSEEQIAADDKFSEIHKDDI